MSNESENKRIDLDAIAARLLQQPSRITNYRRIRTEEFEDIIAELKRCYEEIDALRSITQDWVKIETFTDDGKDLSVDMEDSDGNCFSGYINRASE